MVIFSQRCSLLSMIDPGELDPAADDDDDKTAVDDAADIIPTFTVEIDVDTFDIDSNNKNRIDMNIIVVAVDDDILI